MTRLVVAASTFVLSTIGWYAGMQIGIFSAFTGSVVGTGVGIYVGKQLAERWGA